MAGRRPPDYDFEQARAELEARNAELEDRLANRSGPAEQPNRSDDPRPRSLLVVLTTMMWGRVGLSVNVEYGGLLTTVFNIFFLLLAVIVMGRWLLVAWQAYDFDFIPKLMIVVVSVSIFVSHLLTHADDLIWTAAIASVALLFAASSATEYGSAWLLLFLHHPILTLKETFKRK